MSQLPLSPTAANEAFIQRIVAEVLRRVEQAESAANHPGVGSTQGSQANSLFIDSRVISLVEIDGNLTGMNEIVVPTDSIVTPAVRDELRSRKIKLVRREASANLANNQTDSQSTSLIIVLSAGIDYSPQSLIDSTVVPMRAGGNFECLVAAVNQLESTLEPQGRALVLTDDPRAVACLANRKSTLWAAACRTAKEVEQAHKSIGINLAAVNPAETNPWQLKQIAAALGAGCDSAPKFRPRFKEAD